MRAKEKGRGVASREAGKSAGLVGSFCTILLPDIDECSRSDLNTNCSSLETCNNSMGSFQCVCVQGYEKRNGECKGERGRAQGIVYNLHSCSIRTIFQILTSALSLS